MHHLQATLSGQDQGIQGGAEQGMLRVSASVNQGDRRLFGVVQGGLQDGHKGGDAGTCSYEDQGIRMLLLGIPAEAAVGGEDLQGLPCPEVVCKMIGHLTAGKAFDANAHTRPLFWVGANGIRPPEG